MPRKIYRAKNRFAVKSKLEEAAFATLVWLYLQGKSAPEARKEFAAMDHPLAANAPSEKTISDIFRRLGRYIFHHLFEPDWLRAFPEFFDLQAQDPAAYQIALDVVASSTVEFAMTVISYDDFQAMRDSDPALKERDRMMMEIRKLSAARQGIKGDARADVGLANFRAITILRIAQGKSEEEQVNLMLKTLLDWLLYEPLDEDGNPNQVFRDRKVKFPYGSFGLPDPDYVMKRKKT